VKCLTHIWEVIGWVRFIYDDTSMVFIPHVDKNIAYLDIMGNKGAKGARNVKHYGSKGACRV
jgi:hypothetical protein